MPGECACGKVKDNLAKWFERKYAHITIGLMASDQMLLDWVATPCQCAEENARLRKIEAAAKRIDRLRGLEPCVEMTDALNDLRAALEANDE